MEGMEWDSVSEYGSKTNVSAMEKGPRHQQLADYSQWREHIPANGGRLF